MEKHFFEKPTVYVGEVNVNVTNLKKALEFYQTVIGFRVLEETDNRAVLTANGSTPLLTLEKPDNVVPKEERTTGLYHFAILLPSREDLSAFLRHIAQSGIRIGASDHYVSEAVYLSDPDGNGIEVYRDRPASEWSWSEGQVAMATEPLDAESVLATGNKEWKGLPETTVMGHVHLHVADLEKTEQFYIKGLGFDVVTNYPGALFTSTGNYHHHIALNVWNGAGAPSPRRNTVGMNWFSLEFPNEETRSEAVERLRDIGANVEKEGNYYIAEDPSKIRIQLKA
jgi:catechol 2,3-dioxygenase